MNAGHAKRGQSLDIALGAAVRITSIAETLSSRRELQRCPESFVYDILRALIIYVSDMMIHGPHQIRQEGAWACLSVLKEVSLFWTIPERQIALLESLIQNSTVGQVPGARCAQRNNTAAPLGAQNVSGNEIFKERMAQPGPTNLQSAEQDPESRVHMEQCGFSLSSLSQPSEATDIPLVPDIILQPIHNPRSGTQEALDPWVWLNEDKLTGTQNFKDSDHSNWAHVPDSHGLLIADRFVPCSGQMPTGFANDTKTAI